MTHTEQHRLIIELKDYAHRMKRYDLEALSMFEKRDKDDEDLDQASWKKLLDLYVQHVPAHLRILP